MCRFVSICFFLSVCFLVLFLFVVLFFVFVNVPINLILVHILYRIKTVFCIVFFFSVQNVLVCLSFVIYFKIILDIHSPLKWSVCYETISTNMLHIDLNGIYSNDTKCWQTYLGVLKYNIVVLSINKEGQCLSDTLMHSLIIVYP